MQLFTFTQDSILDTTIRSAVLYLGDVQLGPCTRAGTTETGGAQSEPTGDHLQRVGEVKAEHGPLQRVPVSCDDLK